MFIIISFFAVFGFIGWLIEIIPQIIETGRYKKLLHALGLKVSGIDVDKHYVYLEEIDAEYNEAHNDIYLKYHLADKEPIDTKLIEAINKYNYSRQITRKKRKPSTTHHAYRKYRYRRYY